MKKIIISLIAIAIFLTATPVSAVGFREWDQATKDIIALQEQCGNSATQIQSLTVRVAQLEQENVALKNRVGLVEGLFNQLRGLLIQIIQMLSALKK
jgi:hypothetical protein